MSSITQTIPSYVSGISQQSDYLKVPGQVNKAKNVLPDITEGLQKRPGGKFIASLSDNGTSGLIAATNGKWFHYYRDENEQYIGQISRTGDINMWCCTDVYDTTGVKRHSAGDSIAVDYDSGTSSALTTYLTHSTDEDLQTLTLNDFTYITNRTKTVAMLTNAADKSPVKPAEAYITLKKVAYASQYSLNLFDNTTLTTTTTATRIKVDRIHDSSNSCLSNFSGFSKANAGSANYTYYCDQQSETVNTLVMRDSLCPNTATQIFSGIGSGVSYTDIEDSHSISVNGNNTSGRSGLYFRIRTIGQAVPKGGGDNLNYNSRYTTTYDLLYGGTGWQVNDYFHVWMHNAYYKITILEVSESKVQANLGLIRPTPTPFDTETTVTAENIIGEIRADIIAADSSWVDWTESALDGITGYGIKQIGNGLYIRRNNSTKFNLNTPVAELLNVFTDAVDDVSELPQQCRHGYVVKVSNSEAEQDDYYVKFFGNDDRDGSGVWEECSKPNTEIKYDPGTMPVQLVRKFQSNTVSFDLSQVTWDESVAGDTVEDGTNPRASFVGKTINKMLFWRNRMVMLSDENVILSQPGYFTNFWSKSAITYGAGDMIDISASSEFPAIVYDGIHTNAGLVLFSKNQQFLLTTDSDILSPITAKLNSLSSYNFNYKTNPINLGTTVGFIDNAGKYSRFWEMARILREGEPVVIEQSKVVSNLFDKDLTLVSNSRENGVIFFSKKGESTLYGYRYFNVSDKRLQEAWFTWDMMGAVQHHAVLDDSLYVVVRNNSKDVLQKISIKLHSDSNTVTDDFDTTDTDDDIIYRIHLDNSKIITAGSLTYTTATDKTHFTKPDGFNVDTSDTTRKLVVYCHKADSTSGSSQAAQDSDLVGSYSEASVNGSNIEWAGDWTDHDIIVGYLFDYEIEFPTFYYTQRHGDQWKSDINGSLVIHRAKINFGKNGLYTTTLKRKGKPDYVETYEPSLADQYRANQIAMNEEYTQTVPIYDRNTNTTLTLNSTHPSPATLHSMTWEGDFTNKFYQRV